MNNNLIYYIAILDGNYVIKNCSKFCNKTKTGSYRFKTIGLAYKKVKELMNK